MGLRGSEHTYFVYHSQKGDELDKSAAFGVVASIVRIKGAKPKANCLGYAMTSRHIGSDEASEWCVVELGFELVVVCL